MKNFYCKQCGFSGTRRDVRKHLRDFHLFNRKDNAGYDGKFYSVDENGNIKEYTKGGK